MLNINILLQNLTLRFQTQLKTLNGMFQDSKALREVMNFKLTKCKMRQVKTYGTNEQTDMVTTWASHPS